MKIKIKTKVFNPPTIKEDSRKRTLYSAERYEDGKRTVFSVMTFKEGI